MIFIMSKKSDVYKVLANRLIINGALEYKKRFILEVDILSDEDKEKILKEFDTQIENLEKMNERYKTNNR